MNRETVLKNLCHYDKRSPYHNPEYSREPRNICSCMNCFHGRDKMAVEILRLWDEQVVVTEREDCAIQLAASIRHERAMQKSWEKGLPRATEQGSESEEVRG